MNKIELRHAFWAFMLFALAGCVSCSMNGTKTAEDLIEAAGDSGCSIRAIKFDDDHVKQIDCNDVVRVVR